MKRTPTLSKQVKAMGKLSILSLLAALLLSSVAMVQVCAAGSHEIMHPMMKPKMYSKNMSCPNCGMMINMWARTRHTFSNDEGQHETCSIRCLADMSNKAGQDAKDVKVAVYKDPDTMVDAAAATYVVGSKAKGTMTMKSKIAFADGETAKTFVEKHGGETADFQGALKMAKMEVNKTREKIQGNRMKKGKIVATTESDSCGACGMYPSKFPAHRSQVTTADGNHIHFCSTKCLVNFSSEPSKYGSKDGAIKASWVTAYPDGDYEYANGLYYLVGSKIMGPMGSEALPYRSKAAAHEAAAKEGGKVVTWSELTPDLMKGMGHGHGGMKMH